MPPQLRPILEKDYPEFLEYHLEMHDILVRLYYARASMNQPKVIELLIEVDNFFRDENYN